MTRLTPQDVRLIRAIYAHPRNPANMQDLAQRFEVDSGTISHVLQRETWRGEEYEPAGSRLWVPAWRTVGSGEGVPA